MRNFDHTLHFCSNSKLILPQSASLAGVGSHISSKAGKLVWKQHNTIDPLLKSTLELLGWINLTPLLYTVHEWRICCTQHSKFQCMLGGGGLLKYDLGRDMPLRLEKSRPIFVPNFAQKWDPFYTRVTNFKQNLLQISYKFPKLLSFWSNFGNIGIRLMKFSRQF